MTTVVGDDHQLKMVIKPEQIEYFAEHALAFLKLPAPQRKIVREVILALNATVDGQTTAHYIAERLAGTGVEITSLARGVPVGGELDWLDDGTLATAFKARRAL